MKNIIYLCLVLFCTISVTPTFAVKPTPPVVEEVLEDEVVLSPEEAKKQEKKLKKVAKLKEKISKKITKKMEKREMKQQKRGVLDEPNIRLGLICLLAAILVGLFAGLKIIGGLFGIISGVLAVIGIVLIILGLLNY